MARVTCRASSAGTETRLIRLGWKSANADVVAMFVSDCTAVVFIHQPHEEALQGLALWILQSGKLVKAQE